MLWKKKEGEKTWQGKRNWDCPGWAGKWGGSCNVKDGGYSGALRKRPLEQRCEGVERLSQGYMRFGELRGAPS